ncbi:hypothetical protein RvVAT039_pl03080 (plasmid) [Agrobacterium vitis]|uniref:EamA family transporter n=1 Tax=Agrobacterium vitis TaxID=373 RepID=UPI0015DAA5B2|nr:EamA family transporter [Agrobacterium vitis]BCH67475.1 hypothetical protein RvVAT039_pl03080 [Agrobacterium vitis]
MKPQHILLALLVAAIWGVNFTVISVGLGSFPPLLLAAVRFAIAAIPALFLPRPNIRWPLLIWIGATLFLGQFALLFSGMSVGITAGLASVVLQSQAFLTILIASAFLRERPTFRHVSGTLVAFAGLVVIAGTAGGVDFTMTGFGLCLAAALCWAVGNVLLKRSGTTTDMFALVAWLSIIPPLPLLLLSLIMDGPARLSHAVQTMSWSGIGAVLYIAVLSTTVCFAIWGQLLKKYPASAVAPFSLLVPIFGAASAALFLGEKFEAMRIVGMVMVVAGLVVVVIPARRFWRYQRT